MFPSFATSDNSALGASSKSTEPRVEQVFVENTRDLPWREFDAQLYRLRRLVETEVASVEAQRGQFYICSLSSQTVTYKGQLTPEQVIGYYKDLQVSNP